MKPPPFRYVAPEHTEEALAALGDVGDEAKVLAGGQSLIPLLNMRLAAPAVLVDINRVAGLDGIETTDDGVRVGATVRHSALEHDGDAVTRLPLLSQALRHVAHPVIRNRGTVVGSIAHADPAAELPAVLGVLGGSVEVRSTAGERVVNAEDLYVGPLESSLEPTELITHARFPVPEGPWGSAFEELARRHGDYALAGVAALVTLDSDGMVATARASFTGVGPVPVVVGISAELEGQDPVALDTDEAVSTALQAIEPQSDIHATAEYRRHLSGVLLARALREAASAAADRGGSV
ncbi:MAG: xanthine dehydrogenase family protein subunit M [Nitriliruptorales bacterium]|nr:xanthine dehydrogenase family protein subunit M [Nitriliruptorales bacterium]